VPRGPPEPNPAATGQAHGFAINTPLTRNSSLSAVANFSFDSKMGQAKRRKEQFRKTPQTCVLCGARAATTMDHVPPKALFPSPPPKLITVPTCEICNGSASDAEEKFRVYLSAKSGIDTPNSIGFWKKGGLRTVRNNKKLLRELMSGTPLFIRSPSTGRFERTRTFKWPHDPVIDKITRGLYYHHFGNPLPASAEIEVAFLNGLPDPVSEFAMGQDLVRCNLGIWVQMTGFAMRMLA
jgi:hypothetical protein